MSSTRQHRRLRQAISRWVPFSARVRLFIAVLLATIVALATPHIRLTLRILLAWNVGTWVLVAMAWTLLLTADESETKARAATEDPGRLFVHILVLLSAMLSLVAAVALLRERATSHASRDALWWLVCIGAVGGAWLLNHTSWTLRYAHLYYRDDHEGIGGLVFPGEQPPDDMDFAYFAFTIGMCAQTSDVMVTSRQIRRAVLVHSIQSFAFNTTVIALMLNVVFGLLNG
jgi:uncharacterized membrane protein